jgi:hypothetical protein
MLLSWRCSQGKRGRCWPSRRAPSSASRMKPSQPRLGGAVISSDDGLLLGQRAHVLHCASRLTRATARTRCALASNQLSILEDRCSPKGNRKHDHTGSPRYHHAQEENLPSCHYPAPLEIGVTASPSPIDACLSRPVVDFLLIGMRTPGPWFSGRGSRQTEWLERYRQSWIDQRRAAETRQWIVPPRKMKRCKPCDSGSTSSAASRCPIAGQTGEYLPGNW